MDARSSSSQNSQGSRQNGLTHADISQAIAEERMGLCLQPVVSASEHNFVAFYEGLIRIIHPSGAVHVAGEFMPHVEGYDLGNFIDQIALEIALHKLSVSKTARISVNMSLRTLWDQDWLHILESNAKRYPGIANRLIVEFTEQSVLQDPSRMIDFMQHCRALGVSFAVDDFGAGNTVIGHLRDFRFDILKVDGSICRDIGENRDNQVVLEAIISIAEHFEMMTIAEHIDNMPAATKARELGISGLQGFLFGRGDLYQMPNTLQINK